MKPTCMKSYTSNLLMWSNLTLDPSLQGQTRIAKLKSAYNSLNIILEVWDGKPTFRKLWAGNLLLWSDLTLGPSTRSNEDS